MGKYIIKRLLYVFVVLILLTFILYNVYSLVPQNRAYTDAKTEVNSMKNIIKPEELDAKFNELYLKYQRMYGTDTDNKIVRYLRWVGVYPFYNGQCNGLLQGNFGYSWEERAEVVTVIADPMKNTLFLNIFVTIIALGITIPLGIRCAVKRGSVLDKTVQVVTIVGYSLPIFIFCIFFIFIFCSVLRWLPPSGMKTPGSNYTGWKWFWDRVYYMILPIITLTFSSLAYMTRLTRTAMLDALSMDCIRTARAKGVRERTVIYSHAWRNALIPIITVVIGWFLGLFGGSMITESMFGLNGMGTLFLKSMRTADYDVIMLIECFYVFIGLIGNLITDLVYGLVDPRVRVNK